MRTHSETNGFMADLMQNLKQGYHCCYFKKGELTPCAYHRNRAGSIIYGVFDTHNPGLRPVGENVHYAPLDLTPQTRRMLDTLATGGNLAGGWYLVQEQREWLQERLTEIFENCYGECHILVSGVAGYAHFYSYLQILCDAARAANLDCSRLHIDVADTCITPLLEIAAIETAVRSRCRTLFLKHSIRRNLPAFELPLPHENIAFIKQLIPDIRSCTVRVFHCDIESLESHRMELAGSYDVITEHFLISMLENVVELIEKSRSAYASLLKPHGHLLMACGFNTRPFLDTLLELHKKFGFETDQEKIYKVWDPFGISQSELQYISNGDDQYPLVALENCMIDFARKKPSESTAAGACVTAQ